MGVAVDAGARIQLVVVDDRAGGMPIDEFPLDGAALRVTAYLAFASVASGSAAGRLPRRVLLFLSLCIIHREISCGGGVRKSELCKGSSTEMKNCGKLERENGKKWEFGNVCWIWRIKLRCATLQALHFAVLRHAGVPGAMRLSLFGSGVRAVLLLLPAALTLCLTFYVWTSRKRPDLSEGRVKIFRWV